MKKNFLAVLAVAIALIATAFTKEKAPVIKQDPNAAFLTYYFKFKSTNFTALGYLNPLNWEARGFNPGTDNCPAGPDEKPCVIAVDLASGQSSVIYLIAFLADLGSLDDIINYVEDPGNIWYYQPGY
jgi:hypothetical protein